MAAAYFVDMSPVGGRCPPTKRYRSCGTPRAGGLDHSRVTHAMVVGEIDGSECNGVGVITSGDGRPEEWWTVTRGTFSVVKLVSNTNGIPFLFIPRGLMMPIARTEIPEMVVENVPRDYGDMNWIEDVILECAAFDGFSWDCNGR